MPVENLMQSLTYHINGWILIRWLISIPGDNIKVHVINQSRPKNTFIATFFSYTITMVYFTLAICNSILLFNFSNNRFIQWDEIQSFLFELFSIIILFNETWEAYWHRDWGEFDSNFRFEKTFFFRILRESCLNENIYSYQSVDGYATANINLVVEMCFPFTFFSVIS